MESRRQQQIAREIQKEIGHLFQKSGPSIYGNAFVTVTHVKITPDLLIARIYLSVYNTEEKQKVIDTIQAQHSEIRYRLGNAMRHQLRRIPELEFFLDDSLDYVYKMEEIFKDIKPEDKEEESSEDESSED